ncbi:hypothetical protein GCM10011501_19520 [Thalassotalea profundi]|uniref:Uncharacterized protein n=1 Tax=Thalassotalea profundi TaxID=2036687 RepID=A0ABQ3IQB1_9GAMM|nr:hypothetical protein GCM10011501_19520 [Thalassotalea profundi]
MFSTYNKKAYQLPQYQFNIFPIELFRYIKHCRDINKSTANQVRNNCDFVIKETS